MDAGTQNGMPRWRCFCWHKSTNGVSWFFHADGLGSVRGLSDASGALTDSYTYDAYGLLTSSSGATVNPYLYRGEQYEADLNAYYLRARYYQPGTGRFLTTDPMEGVPNSPLTLHRYVYGNDAPTNFLDPSGKMSLVETMATVGIVGTLGNLSLMALSYTEVGQDLYATFAEYVYPEAYIVGANVMGTIPFAYQNFLYMLFDQSPIPYNVQEMFNAVFGVGRELVISIGSGEAALFETHAFGASFPFPSLSAGFELYDGFVFNLWNVKDYHGPFESISFGLNTKAPVNIGLSLFWDAERKFDGPWGGANTFLSKSWGIYFSLNAGKSFVNYEIVGKQNLNRSRAVAAIYAILFATKMIESIDKGGTGAVMTGASYLFEVTMWANIELAHHYWNQKASLYNIENRREWLRDQVPGGYHSGPRSMTF